MIRNIRHSLSMLLSLAALALVPASPAVTQAAEAATRMELPAPNKTGGMPLMQALNARRSTKTNYSGAALSAQQLSDLLWATWGVNREDGRRTAPTAMNRQDVRVYVALENGVWLYDADNALIKVLEGDWRGQMGGGEAGQAVGTGRELVVDGEAEIAIRLGEIAEAFDAESVGAFAPHHHRVGVVDRRIG